MTPFNMLKIRPASSSPLPHTLLVPQTLSAGRDRAQSMHVPQPVPDVVPSTPPLHGPGETPGAPPPEMPPNSVPPEIIEPALPGEHSPVRDPQTPRQRSPQWSQHST